MHRLCFDLQLAAATKGYYLNLYYDDVDHDGFDLILDDQDSIKKIQVKTVESDSPTQCWKIQKKILRPAFDNVEKLGFEPSPEGEGIEGGFVLCKFEIVQEAVKLDYFYTDLFVCLAFKHGIIRRKNKLSQAAVERCVHAFTTGIGREAVHVPAALMLHASTPADVLALSGLHGPSDHMWKHNIMTVANHTQTAVPHTIKLTETLAALRRRAGENMLRLIQDTDIELCE